MARESLRHTLLLTMRVAHGSCLRAARAGEHSIPTLLLMVDAQRNIRVVTLDDAMEFSTERAMHEVVQAAARHSQIPDIEVMVVMFEGAGITVTLDPEHLPDDPSDLIDAAAENIREGPKPEHSWCVLISGESIEGHFMDLVMQASLTDDGGLRLEPFPNEDHAPLLHGFHPMFPAYRRRAPR